ncbi:MAG: copper chaperone PCu(A)C [Burkholderiales bacterium]
MSKFSFALLAALAAGVAHAQVEVQDPWVRGMVPAQKATGAFLRITSTKAAKLVGASSPAAGVVEIHRSSMEGGVMRMRRVEAIELPAGQAVELKPGGYHVMMMQVPKPLTEGQSVPITLVVETADGARESVAIEAPVRALGTPAHGHGHGPGKR